MSTTRALIAAAIVMAVAVAHTSTGPGAQTPPTPQATLSPAQILQTTIDALAHVESAEYDVRLLDGYSVGGAKVKGHSSIVVSRAPFQYRSRLTTDDGARREVAVFDGTTSRFSTDGTVMDAPPNAMVNQASADALNTRSTFDRDYFAKALASGRIVYAGLDDVDGDTCRVIEYVTLADKEIGSNTSIYWLSVKTGLPRSVQTWRLVRGRTLLTDRWILSNIQLNPTMAPDTFTFRPTSVDSTRAAAAPPAVPVATKLAAGSVVPDLDVRDRDNTPVALSTLKGTATILTFWAPWCAPCLAEMPILQKLQARHAGKLGIAAIAVKDSRLTILQFIDQHAGYGFRFFVDPDLGQSQTRLEAFFEITGIPVSVFVDARGRILDHWAGFDGEGPLTARVETLMSRAVVISARY